MRQPLRIFFLLSLFLLLVAGCGSSPAANQPSTPAPVTLNVFAAASLTESFGEIAKQYQASHPNIKIVYNFNGSQILVQQIINGANADIFASADTVNMNKAVDAKAVSSSQIFARNKLAVIIPVSNPGNITSLKDLARKGLKIVLAAPTVPAGKYSIQILDTMAKSPDYGPTFESGVKANVVSQEDNVKAVVQKVQLGEADAGIVYQTDVTVAVANQIKMIDIPDNFNVVAEYPVAVTLKSAHSTEAQAFVQYLLSPAGQAVLTKFHFIGVNGGGS
ncbi:MAG TPA: molybdate ABC transporter substrate-binding protein [Ktedonosporobacter sp.]|nr:molybdate ABC transporter substrate-binding protein [Ktedonosporobacter sp.]